MKQWLGWRALAVVVVALLMTGCAGPMTLYSPGALPFSEPAIGVQTTAAPGDPLLRQGTVRRYDAIRLTRAVTMKGAGEFLVPPGVYLKEQENTSGEYFSWDEVTHPTRGGISSNGRVLKHLVVIKSQSGRSVLCALTFTNLPFCAEDPPVERTVADVADTDSFQRTLLYSGRVGNRITLGYREFSGSTARPAFSNQVDYDLTESKVLVYQGAQIEVLEATNQAIVYRVLRNFNAAR